MDSSDSLPVIPGSKIKGILGDPLWFLPSDDFKSLHNTCELESKPILSVSMEAQPSSGIIMERILLNFALVWYLSYHIVTL